MEVVNGDDGSGVGINFVDNESKTGVQTQEVDVFKGIKSEDVVVANQLFSAKKLKAIIDMEIKMSENSKDQNAVFEKVLAIFNHAENSTLKFNACVYLINYYLNKLIESEERDNPLQYYFTILNNYMVAIKKKYNSLSDNEEEFKQDEGLIRPLFCVLYKHNEKVFNENPATLNDVICAIISFYNKKYPLFYKALCQKLGKPGVGVLELRNILANHEDRFKLIFEALFPYTVINDYKSEDSILKSVFDEFSDSIKKLFSKENLGRLLADGNFDAEFKGDLNKVYNLLFLLLRAIESSNCQGDQFLKDLIDAFPENLKVKFKEIIKEHINPDPIEEKEESKVEKAFYMKIIGWMADFLTACLWFFLGFFGDFKADNEGDKSKPKTERKVLTEEEMITEFSKELEDVDAFSNLVVNAMFKLIPEGARKRMGYKEDA